MATEELAGTKRLALLGVLTALCLFENFQNYSGS